MTAAPGRPADRAELHRDRLERVEVWCERHGADALVLRAAENLAWVTGGGDLLVSREGAPVATAVVNGDGLWLVTDRIEAPRLEAEVVPTGTVLETVEWHEPGARQRAVDERVRGLRTISDGEADLATLRLPLTEIEHARLARSGADAARALTDAAERLEPTLTEHQVAAVVQGALRAEGLELPVVLVAGEERFGRYRHPVATSAPFGAFGLLVVCAQRHGLVASCSRTVAFGSAPGLLAERLERVLQVEAAMLAATRPDVPTNAVLRAAQDAYAAAGERDAWRDHHQGGPAAYMPREWLATPTETRLLRAGTPIAWNPSLPFAKSEDTFWLGDDGLANLTWDDRWPSRLVDGRPRAEVLVL